MRRTSVRATYVRHKNTREIGSVLAGTLYPAEAAGPDRTRARLPALLSYFGTTVPATGGTTTSGGTTGTTAVSAAARK